MSYIQLILSVILFTANGDPAWQLYKLDKEGSLRGIAAIDENRCWVGGSNSTLAKTTDGGKTWVYFNLVEADDFEFRDIQAFGKDKAIVMSAGEGEKSRVFKTTDGGNSWKTVFENKHPKGFFNGIAFWNENEGILTGDPIDGKLYVAVTRDGGETWQQITELPPVEDGEYGFAASGSHIAVKGDHVWIGTGGSVSRVFHSEDKGRSWEVVETPILQGSASQGIFSLAFLNNGKGVAVGGDYTDENALGNNNIIYSEDHGKTWKAYDDLELPFRSSVRFIQDAEIITGPSGSEYSEDGGRTWRKLSGEGFHALDIGGNVIWAAGSGGRIGKLMLDI